MDPSSFEVMDRLGRVYKVSMLIPTTAQGRSVDLLALMFTAYMVDGEQVEELGYGVWKHPVTQELLMHV